MQSACQGGLHGGTVSSNRCVDRGALTKSSRYLPRLALNEEINSLMLLPQFPVQLILESVKSFCFIVTTRYSLCFPLALGGADLDQMLDVIIINIVWCRVTSQ